MGSFACVQLQNPLLNVIACHLPADKLARMRRKSLLLLLGLALFIACALFLWSRTKSATPAFIGSNRIGYYNLVRAVNLLQDLNHDPATNYIATYLQTNAAALMLLREALTEPCEAPPETYQAGMVNVTDIGAFKNLALVLKVEGRQAELQHRPADAARSYLDTIRLGQKIESGPLVSLMIGLSIEKSGLESLEKLELHLTGPSRAEVATALKQINTHRISFSAIEERERYIRRKLSPTPLHYMIASRAVRSAMNKGQEKYEATKIATEHLATKLGK